jgi:imidazole glycerol-phosphate synthase subunit HisH
MIAIIDYGVGNLYSLSRSLESLGLQTQVTRDEAELRAADKIILPGVGAFGDAMEKLVATGLVPVVKERASAGVPLLGICLGMQLLFEKGYEYGEHDGLGLMPGEIRPMADDLPKDLKVPHIGWNALNIHRECPILKYVQEGNCVYYVHSFYAVGCEDETCATSEYGVPVTGVVQKANVFGTQFHPEKSGRVGLSILKAFGEVLA